jgi:iron(III) transport system substrate-binding protein
MFSTTAIPLARIPAASGRPARLRALAPVGAVLGALVGSLLSGSVSAQEINLYTYREPGLIKPLLDAFTKETGIKVNTIFANAGLEERMRAEGERSPADILLTVDIGRLQQAKELGITQPVNSEVLSSAIPAAYRDPEGHWFGVSLRGRVVYASKDLVPQNAIAYEDLADPKWKGKLCTRSGQHLYNVSLFAAVVAHQGPQVAEEWLKGVKANLAKKPSGGDREVAKDIKAGGCDIGLGNTYYVALMQTGSNADQKGWAEAIKVILPTFKDTSGTHVNISGMSLAKSAPNRDSALKFMAFMVSDQAQKLHADLNYEYPIKQGIAINPTIATFGPLKPDTVPIAEIAKQRKTASELVDKVGYDQ